MSAPVSIPIKVHWSLGVLLAGVHALVGVAAAGALLGWAGPANPPGSEWAGLGFAALVLVVADMLALPMYVCHRVSFENEYLAIYLGLHRARIPYRDIDFVSENLGGAAGYVWKPTAPEAVRIHGRLHEEAVSVADKELLYEELLKRNPRIRIER